MTKAIIGLTAALALSLAFAGTAAAQGATGQGTICVLDGNATISSAIPPVPAPGGVSKGFSFTGTLSNCTDALCNGKTISSSGTLVAFGCEANTHQGTVTGVSGCLAVASVGKTFNGRCVGTNCTGSTDPTMPTAKGGLMYSLNFDNINGGNPNDPNNAVGDVQACLPGGAGVSSAHFSGPIAFKY